VRPHFLTAVVLLWSVSSWVCASEWITCYGDTHQIEFLIGGLPKASITSFAIYVDGAAQNPKRWKVSLRYVDIKQARLYFSAVARDAGDEPNISAAVDGGVGSLHWGQLSEGVSCDWNGINE
jgi:hypothetical protein